MFNGRRLKTARPIKATISAEHEATRANNSRLRREARKCNENKGRAACTRVVGAIVRARYTNRFGHNYEARRRAFFRRVTDVSADAQRGSARDLFCVQLVIFGLISRPRAPRHGRGKNIRSGDSGGEGKKGRTGKAASAGKGRGSARVCTNFNLRRKSAGEILQTNFPARTGCLLRSLRAPGIPLPGFSLVALSLLTRKRDNPPLR